MKYIRDGVEYVCGSATWVLKWSSQWWAVPRHGTTQQYALGGWNEKASERLKYLGLTPSPTWQRIVELETKLSDALAHITHLEAALDATRVELGDLQESLK